MFDRGGIMKKALLFLVPFIALGVIRFSSLSSHAETNGIEDGQIYYLQNQYSGLFMEAENSYLQQNTFSGSSNQQFVVKYVKGSGDQFIYTIIPFSNPDLQLDIDNASSKNGSRVKLFHNNPGYAYAQQFRLVPNGNGTFRLLSQVTNQSEKAVEVAGPSKKEKARIQIWDYVKGKNQQWILAPLEVSATRELESTSVPVYANGVTMTTNQAVYPSGTTSITITILNSTSNSISYGQDFQLLKHEGSKWKEYQPKEEIIWDMMGYGNSPGKSNSMVLHMNSVTNEKLIPGEYKIIKSYGYDGESEKYTVEAEFTVQ